MRGRIDQRLPVRPCYTYILLIQGAASLGVSFSWKENPQKAIVPLCRDPLGIKRRRNFDLAFEFPMIDFHIDYPYRLARGGVGHLFLLNRFRCGAIAAYPKALRRDRNLDLVGIDTGKFDAYSKAGSALEDIDFGAPRITFLPKIREMNFCNLVGHLPQLSSEIPKSNRTNLLSHNKQWMRSAREATANN